jgi:hypothetical protein
MVKSKSVSLPIIKNCDKANTWIYITFIIKIIIVILIIVSLDNLEKSNCDCSKIPERRFIKLWFMLLIVIYTILFISFYISNEECWSSFKNYPFITGLMLIIGIINIVMLIRLFIYIKILREKCECGYGNKERFLFWYLILYFIIMGFSLLVLLFTIAMLFSLNYYNNK